MIKIRKKDQYSICEFQSHIMSLFFVVIKAFLSFVKTLRKLVSLASR